MKETIFVDGMSFFQPGVKAPDFVKGNISIQPQKLIQFFKDHKDKLSDKGYFSIDLKESKAGTWYFSLNTYKPGNSTEV